MSGCRKSRLRIGVCVLVVVAAAAVQSAWATTHEVIVRDFEFDPAHITIAAGDTVLWIWESGTHTVTSGVDCVPDGLFHSPIDSETPEFAYTFADPGFYPYFCVPHCLFFMTGSVTVESAGTGACCIPDEGCIDDVDPTLCDDVGGLFQGEGSTCAESVPQVFFGPASKVVCEGSPVVLYVEAGGSAPLSYEWFHNGVPIGVTESTLIIDAVTGEDAGTYFVRVSNRCGSVDSQLARIWTYDGVGDLPPAVAVAPHRVPERWQNPEDVAWIGDVEPRNKIDDDIDAAPSGPHDIIVNFKTEVQPSQVNFLSMLGSVQYVARFVSSVFVGGVATEDIELIAARPDVAFIELQRDPVFFLDVATQATKVTSGFYTPDTVADQYPGLTGAGVNIVIFDSGVSNTHADFPAALFFYDAATATFTDPDDPIGHGSHVAGIALGRGTATVSPGVAPGAGLIDVSMFGASAAQVQQALDEIILRRAAWNVGVINMSFGFPTPSDGQDAFSQTVDTAVGLGIAVVAAAGNNGPTPTGFGSPAAASTAIVVANSQDQGTPDRSDDTLRSTSSRGPRDDDQDGNCLDELVPHVAAPGTNIFSADPTTASDGINRTGTSMAAPHVAGVCALLLEGDPNLTPGAIKQVLIATAERRGTPSDPACDPDWNDGWGWGLIDAHAAVATALGAPPPGGPQPTDMGFATFTGFVYANTRIETTSPPKVGVANQIRALVENYGPNDATNVTVKFKIDYISAAAGAFYDVGDVIVPSIPAGTQQFVSIAWTPQHPSHQCLKAMIDYAPDTNPANNLAQRNITVAQSPVYFRVENLICPEPILIDFIPTFETPSAGWGVQITPPSVELAGGEFAMIEALPLPPDGAPAGETETIYISAVHGDCLLGGVAVIATVRDCNGNGIDDWYDIQSGASTDCNGNGIPDECDLDAGTSADINGNGIPDECEEMNLDHPEADPLEPVADPTGPWHEMWPVFCTPWECDRWQDNGTGVLDPCDYMHLESLESGDSAWYHVENVTATLWVYDPVAPSDLHTLDYVGDDIPGALFEPTRTTWDEVWPNHGGWFVVLDWFDADGDGRLSPGDVLLLFDSDGIVSEYVIEQVSTDVDLVPGIPDCNENGVPDDEDIAAGTSTDFNSNGIPDECDIAECRSYDLNHNGIPDEVEIADGTQADANTNGIIDEAEQPDDEHSSIPMQDGSFLDDELAEKLKELLINTNGTANVKDAKFFFQQCFGGGMLDDLEEALDGSVPWVGGSASRHDEPAYGERDDPDNPDEPMNRWTRPLRDALKDRTAFRGLKKAAREDAANPLNRDRQTERPQYRVGGDGARDITLKDPAASSHHAVMLAGRPDAQRHRNNIREMCELLKEEWGNLNTNGTSVHIVYGDGSDNPCAGSGVPDGNVSAATTNGLCQVLENLRDDLGDGEEFVFYVTDHGDWEADADGGGGFAPTRGGVSEYGFDVPGSVRHGMIRERYNRPFIAVRASGPYPPETVGVTLNGRWIGYLDPGASDGQGNNVTTLFISDRWAEVGSNVVAIDLTAAPDILIELVRFGTGSISCLVERGWGDADGDGDVELDDLPPFVNCLSGPGGGWLDATCPYSDVDEDGDVDLDDYRLFQQVHTGSL